MQSNIIGPFSPDPEAESTLDQQYIGAIGQVRAVCGRNGILLSR
jgi:hypothetical protein